MLYEKIGPGPHTCHWCNDEINWLYNQRGNRKEAITADHLNDDPLDDRPENLVPSCGPCNGARPRAIGDNEAAVIRSDGSRLRAKTASCTSCAREFNATYGRVCSTCRKKRSHSNPRLFDC